MDYPRDTPLDVCPDLVCRRSRHCINAQSGLPCRKDVMNEDERREALACKIDELCIKYGGKPYDPFEEVEVSDKDWAELYRMVKEGAAKHAAEERSANVLASRRRLSP